MRVEDAECRSTQDDPGDQLADDCRLSNALSQDAEQLCGEEKRGENKEQVRQRVFRQEKIPRGSISEPRLRVSFSVTRRLGLPR